MVKLQFVTVDVFTTTRFAGNPLAIVRVPKETILTTEKMQLIAREFNLSETVILHEEPEPGADDLPEWRCRIFLTNAEVPFAGHPTIGTACYALGTLAKGTSKARLICNAGPIDLTFENNIAKASIPHDMHIHTENPYPVEQVHRLQPSLSTTTPPSIQLLSPVRGMTFLCVELPDLHALSTLTLTPLSPNATRDKAWDVGFLGTYFYVITQRTPIGEEPVRIRSRMLEKGFEDPATGSAACALTGYLALGLKRRVTRFVVTQGVEMGRGSEIGVEVGLKEGFGEVESVVLSGGSVGVMEGVVEVD